MAINLLRARRLALLASSSLLVVTPALADGAPPAAAPEATNSSEIVVTATKRSENLQNVPISIVAMSNTTLTQHQVSSFDDYAKMMPSVSYQSFGPGQSQLNFRGITNGGDGIALGPLPTAGLYINETPVTTVYGAVDMHVYDMDHVEALSGPQGTLYGASSLAGTMRLITAAPRIGKWEGGIDVEGNKFGNGGGTGGKLEGYVNIPLGQRAALRVVGFYEHDGGYISNSPANRTYQRGTGVDAMGNPITNPLTISNAPYVKKNFNTVDQVGGRAALKVNLDDNWTMTPMVIYQHQIADGTYLYNDPSNANYSAGYVPGYGSLQVHDFTPDHNRDAWYLASMTLQGKVSDWDVTYNGSYFGRQADTVADYSYFSVLYDGYSGAAATAASYASYSYFTDSSGHAMDPTQTYHTHDSYTKMSHELRISTPATNPLRLTAGLYMQRQTDAHTADYIINNLSQSNEYTTYPWVIAGAPANDVYATNLYLVDRDYAAYAEGSFDPGSGLTITGGIRVFKYDNTLYGFSGANTALARSATVNNCTGTVTIQSCPNVNKDATGTGETHKISASWKVAPGKMFYATYSTGFRPGGNNRDVYYQLNGGPVHVQSVGPFGADKLNNYEIGWKTSWFNRTVYFDGALFLENWNNMQYNQPGFFGIAYTLNAGSARSQGVEASLSWRPVHGLNMSVNGTYLDAKLTSDFKCLVQAGCGGYSFGDTIAPNGTRLPITPHFKVNATARYDWMMGDSKLFLQGGLNHQSGTTSYLATSGEAAVGGTNGFTTADFSAGLSQGSWSLTAYLNNAFNEMGVLSKNSECAPTLCGSQARLYPTKPQEFGLKAGYKF